MVTTWRQPQVVTGGKRDPLVEFVSSTPRLLQLGHAAVMRNSFAAVNRPGPALELIHETALAIAPFVVPPESLGKSETGTAELRGRTV